MKRVLDMTAGSRMMWFDPHNTSAVFVDNRTLDTELCDGRRLEIKPDVVADFRALPEDKHEAWGRRMLADALNIHGMECETLTPATGWRKGARLTHHRVCYHGHGSVKNQANLERLMLNGVGRAKAYGCGLMVVNPL